MSETLLYGPLEGDNARALMHQCISAYMHTVSLQTDSMYFSGYIHDDDWFLRLVLAQTSTYMALNTCVCSYKNVGATISSYFPSCHVMSVLDYTQTYVSCGDGDIVRGRLGIQDGTEGPCYVGIRAEGPWTGKTMGCLAV